MNLKGWFIIKISCRAIKYIVTKPQMTRILLEGNSQSGHAGFLIGLATGTVSSKNRRGSTPESRSA
jgi:hypothetical protein